jgi:hypothetical protein
LRFFLENASARPAAPEISGRGASLFLAFFSRRKAYMIQENWAKYEQKPVKEAMR